MTLRHLEIFAAVADCKTMRAAAQKLFISQPSISQAIRELEAEYDVRLFERLNQRLYITDSGQKLLVFARHILESVEECEQVLRSEKEHPMIRIGSSVSVGTVLLDDYLCRFEERYTNVDVRVIVNNTSQIERQVLCNELDLAIVEGKVKSEELNSITINEDELFLVVGRSHPLYSASEITLEMLDGQAMISREDGSMERNQFDEFLRDHAIAMIAKWRCSNTQAIINSVIAGRGIGILSSLLIEKEISSGDLKVLQVEDIHIRRQIKLIYHQGKYLTNAMNEFIKLCKTV